MKVELSTGNGCGEAAVAGSSISAPAAPLVKGSGLGCEIGIGWTNAGASARGRYGGGGATG